MSNVKGVIPKLIVLIFSSTLTIVFNMPTPISIGIQLLEAIQKAYPSDIAILYIVFLRLLGPILVIIDIFLIYVQARRGEYF